MSVTTMITLAEFEADYVDRPDAGTWELVRGVPVMSPPEHTDNLDAAGLLLHYLYTVLPPSEWKGMAGGGVVTRANDPATFRVADLVLTRRTGSSGLYVDNTTTPLVAEVLSPSSHRRDRQEKRREYAGVGIPNYLVIDPRSEVPLTLYTEPRDGDYRASRAGRSVTFTIDGTEVTVNAEDLRI